MKEGAERRRAFAFVVACIEDDQSLMVLKSRIPLPFSPRGLWCASHYRSAPFSRRLRSFRMRGIALHLSAEVGILAWISIQYSVNSYQIV